MDADALKLEYGKQQEGNVSNRMHTYTLLMVVTPQKTKSYNIITVCQYWIPA